MYENGRGVAKDMAEAVAWYNKAAAAGNASAKANLKRLGQ
jgi:TPR repeat protein